MSHCLCVSVEFMCLFVVRRYYPPRVLTPGRCCVCLGRAVDAAFAQGIAARHWPRRTLRNVDIQRHCQRWERQDCVPDQPEVVLSCFRLNADLVCYEAEQLMPWLSFFVALLDKGVKRWSLTG